MTTDCETRLSLVPKPSLLRRICPSFITGGSRHSGINGLSLNDQRLRHVAALNTLATEVIRTHTAFKRYGIAPQILSLADNPDEQIAAASKAWTECLNATNALGTATIIDQKVHHLPTRNEIDGFRIGANRGDTGLSDAFLQMCTVISLHPEMCDNSEMSKWSKDRPEFSDLHCALAGGRWPR